MASKTSNRDSISKYNAFPSICKINFASIFMQMYMIIEYICLYLQIQTLKFTQYGTFNIINMPTMETMAFTEERQLFAKLEQMASYAALNEDEQRQYDADLKAYRTITGQMKSAKDEGKAEGRAEAEQNMIREMFREGLSFEVIARIAKTTVEHIKKILQQ